MAPGRWNVLHGKTGRSINDAPLTAAQAVDVMGDGPSGMWSVPRLWPGATCFILGGGPSLALIDVNRLRNSRVIAVNEAYRLGDWIDVLFFGDARWENGRRALIADFGGLKITRHEGHAKQPGILRVSQKMDRNGIHAEPDAVCWNLSSGGCAINLAVHFGVSRIILLGFDMRKIDGRYNWHDLHTERHPGDPYETHLSAFPAIAADLKSLGVECVNATPGSALDVFPIVDPAEVLP